MIVSPLAARIFARSAAARNGRRSERAYPISDAGQKRRSIGGPRAACAGHRCMALGAQPPTGRRGVTLTPAAEDRGYQQAGG
jgi:hypothetical protein